MIPENMVLFTQDEKTIMKLMSDIQETQEILIKHKTESNVRLKMAASTLKTLSIFA